MWKKILLSLSLLCATQQSYAAANLTPEEAEKVILEHAGDAKFVVLDVRTPEEFRDAHIRGAVLLDFRAADFRSKLTELPRDKTYLLVCRSGNRSSKAMAMMEELKFSNFSHIDGGMIAWQAKQLPVVKGNN